MARPLRAPHQTISRIALAGGGSELRPGEISLAHNGVLFLDELPEFPRATLEILRGPMETGEISIARAKGSLRFPARFALVAAMNPCPCGFLGDSVRGCNCSRYDIVRYRSKISGPLLDRIDMHVNVHRVPLDSLRSKTETGLASKAAKRAVEAARKIQAERFRDEVFANNKSGRIVRTNADMGPQEIRTFANLSRAAERFLDNLQGTALSPRGYYRLLKTARTIADLEGREGVGSAELAEAWGYRMTENEEARGGG